MKEKVFFFSFDILIIQWKLQKKNQRKVKPFLFIWLMCVVIEGCRRKFSISPPNLRRVKKRSVNESTLNR